MTISVTPNPSATPPSCTVAVSITPTYVMSALAVYRNDHNGRTLLRSQPAAGFDSRTVTDYECPYEENVTYDWTATYTNPAGYSTLFNETWASTAAWTTLAGIWNVASNKVRNSTTPAKLLRATATAKYRVTFASFASGTATTAKVVMGTGSSGGDNYFSSGIILSFFGTTLKIQNMTGTAVYTTIDATQPFVVDFNATSVSIVGTGGSATIPGDYQMAGVYLYAVSFAGNQYSLGEVKVESYPAATTLAETSSATSLDPDDAWLIHPGSVSLSVPLAETDTTAAGIVDISPVENPSNATVHKILGSATPIPTTTGPRTDDRTTMTIATVTAAESVSLRALLAPDVPLLVQVPPSWDLDFNSGFYQVGDTSVGRTGEVRSARRIVTLPMQKVQSPVVDVENTGWSYASVAAEFATYLDLVTNFATYADLAANTRV